MSGAALLCGPEPTQSVQPATDPCAQEAHQHRGQAMGPRPQQATQTKGLWLTYAHTHVTHTHRLFPFFLSFVLSYLSLCHLHLFALPLFYAQCIPLYVRVSSRRVSSFQRRVDYCSYLMALLTAVEAVM